MSETPSFDEVREVVEQEICPVCHAGRLDLTREVFPVERWIATCTSCDARFEATGAEYDDPE